MKILFTSNILENPVLLKTNQEKEFHARLRKKKDVNWDSHIASSPISQSSFFKGVHCLILASSQRKLRGYIEFL